MSSSWLKKSAPYPYKKSKRHNYHARGYKFFAMDGANKKQTIVYGDLADDLGLKDRHYSAFKKPLTLIAQFYEDNDLPSLNF